MLGNVLSVLLTAFFTGALARFAVPGPDPMPAWLTVLIGLVGTLIGAGIVVAVTGADPTWFGITGFLVSIALVVVYRRFVQKRPLYGPGAYRFPERGFGVDEYRQRLQRAGIDPDRVGAGFPGGVASVRTPGAPGGTAAPGRPRASGEDPTENPSHFLNLLDELHDNGVLGEEEYTAARTRLLERLRG
jgi:uncharacterized membrane protein YeaQ/YmgE (transglycosylase-associated protein family)